MMFDPLLFDFESLKDDEIDQKIQDLSRKYWLTHNADLKMQIIKFMDIYKQELATRKAKAWEQQYQKRNKDLDNLIQVN